MRCHVLGRAGGASNGVLFQSCRVHLAPINLILLSDCSLDRTRGSRRGGHNWTAKASVRALTQCLGSSIDKSGCLYSLGRSCLCAIDYIRPFEKIASIRVVLIKRAAMKHAVDQIDCSLSYSPTGTLRVRTSCQCLTTALMTLPCEYKMMSTETHRAFRHPLFCLWCL